MTLLPTLTILDTNILVHFVRDDKLGQYIRAKYALLMEVPRPLVSIVTVGEMGSLAKQLQWGKARLEQTSFLLNYFDRAPIETSSVLEAYATIDAYSVRNGVTMGKNDVWIAATAHVLNAHLLTTDKDFDHLHPQFLTRTLLDVTSAESTR